MNYLQNYFFPYQDAWIADRSPLKIAVKSRQIGLSHADNYHSVILASAKDATLDVFISSRDEVQAKLSLADCKQWAETLHLAAVDLGVLVIDPDKSVSAYVLQFANGRRIYCVSSNPNALAGKSGHVKLDEFALHPDQRLLYRVAKPVTTWGGTLSIISTHRGAGTLFNELIRDITERGNPMGWSLHTIPIQKAVEQGLVEKILAKNVSCAGFSLSGGPSNSPRSADRLKPAQLTATDTLHASRSTLHESRAAFLARLEAECIDREQWDQEYCCKPADESTAFLGYDLISACETECLKDYNYLLKCENPLYLGMDVGRKVDLSVIDVGEQIGDVIWDRLRIELLNKPFAEQEFELFRLLALPKLRRACIDSSNIGLQLAERAKARFGWKVEGITFTQAIKEEMAYKLRTAFEDRTLRIPRDANLRADLRGIKKEVTSSGHIRFAGECEDSHCDRFWAKALRQHALRRRVQFGCALA